MKVGEMALVMAVWLFISGFVLVFVSSEAAAPVGIASFSLAVFFLVLLFFEAGPNAEFERGLGK